MDTQTFTPTPEMIKAAKYVGAFRWDIAYTEDDRNLYWQYMLMLTGYDIDNDGTLTVRTKAMVK